MELSLVVIPAFGFEQFAVHGNLVSIGLKWPVTRCGLKLIRTLKVDEISLLNPSDCLFHSNAGN